MHELGAMRTAIERGVERAGVGAVPSRVEITIHDPCRTTPGAVRFYATELLRERGIEGVPVRLSLDCANCQLCDWSGLPSPNDPFCPRCGTPLPVVEGPAVSVHLVRRRAPRCA